MGLTVSCGTADRTKLPSAGYMALDTFCRQQRGYSSGACEVVARGTKVTVTYKGKLADGTVFDDGEESLTFVCGEGGLVPGFHTGILGMKVNESREVVVEPKDAFGERDDRAIIE